jgi:GAF domain-containing protein
MINNEKGRLVAVKRFEKYDFNLDENLVELLKLASSIYETPVAFITLMDEHVQWFKVNYGFEVQQMPRNTSFCTHAIEQPDTFVVPDAASDDRFANNPLVHNVPNIRFYAGAPLASQDGYNIGTLCVMDVRPKSISEAKRQQLKILAKQVIHLMELDIAYKLLDEKMQQIDVQNKTLLDIAFIQSHEFRGPLSTIIGLMNVIKEEEYHSPKQYLQLMEKAVAKLDDKIRLVVKATEVANVVYAHNN